MLFNILVIYLICSVLFSLFSWLVSSSEEKDFNFTAYVFVGLSWPVIVAMAIIIRIGTFCSSRKGSDDSE
jgi:hypothetical protein